MSSNDLSPDSVQQLKVKESTDFYHKSGDIIFQVQTTLYRVHSDLLSKHSEVFRGILGLSGEGGTDNSAPILLEGVETRDFDCLMSWIYDACLRHTPPNSSLTSNYDLLVSILKLSTMYDMPIARAWAIERIEADVSISPVQRIHLARLYSVPKWIRPAFVELFRRRFLSLSPQEIELLTPSAALILAKAQFKLQEALQKLALIPPPTSHSFTCANPQCDEIWHQAWWMKVARHILSSTQTFQLSELPTFVESLKGLQGMTEECRKQTLEMLRQSDGLKVESVIMEKGVQAITQLYDSHIVGYYTDRSSR